MKRLLVFNSISLDGYFTDQNNDMSWAHNPVPDEEWDRYVGSNAKGGGVLLFGRITYELMVSFWPTSAAFQSFPEVAEGMNDLAKVVFSRTLQKASWNNTLLVKEGMADEVRKMKQGTGPDLVILGSGSIVSQLAREQLVDEYQFVATPVILGKGRTMFDGIDEKQNLELINSRIFRNGNVLLCYKPLV
jgi:dihydrofolate reductase